MPPEHEQRLLQVCIRNPTTSNCDRRTLAANTAPRVYELVEAPSRGRRHYWESRQFGRQERA